MGAPKGNKFALGNKGGAPTKYNQDVVKTTLDYLENFSKYEFNEIPSITGLSRALDISDDTLQRWNKQKEKKEFYGILQKILKKQHDVLISKGLSGEFNSNICKLVLGKHGYHDQSKIEQKIGFELESWIDKVGEK